MSDQFPWGLYDSNNNLLGLDSTGTAATVDNYGVIAAFDFRSSSKLMSHPVEEGGFASYNKAQSNARPTVTIAVGGTLTQRQSFLAALDAAKKSTNTYSVVTPEVTYSNYSVIEYAYRRTAQNGVFMLVVEIMLEEIREVSVTYSRTANAQNAQSTGTVSNGMSQPTTSSAKVSKRLLEKLKPW